MSATRFNANDVYFALGWICKFILTVWLVFFIKMAHVARFKSIEVSEIIYVRKGFITCQLST